MMNGGSESTTVKDTEVKELSYLDDAVKILRIVRNPLHITDLVSRISEVRGTPIDRPAVESSLSRHITKSKKSRVVRTRPGYYGLPEWKAMIRDKRVDEAA